MANIVIVLINTYKHSALTLGAELIFTICKPQNLGFLNSHALGSYSCCSCKYQTALFSYGIPHNAPIHAYTRLNMYVSLNPFRILQIENSTNSSQPHPFRLLYWEIKAKRIDTSVPLRFIWKQYKTKGQSVQFATYTSLKKWEQVALRKEKYGFQWKSFKSNGFTALCIRFGHADVVN